MKRFKPKRKKLEYKFATKPAAGEIFEVDGHVLRKSRAVSGEYGLEHLWSLERRDNKNIYHSVCSAYFRSGEHILKVLLDKTLDQKAKPPEIEVKLKLRYVPESNMWEQIK